MKISIPGEALSLNNAYATSRNSNRRFLTDEGKAFKAHVAQHVMAARLKAPRGRLSLTLTLHGRWDTQDGLPRKRDASNCVKLIEDALCEALGIDDRWIRRLTIHAIHDPAAPCIVATLEPLEEGRKA